MLRGGITTPGSRWCGAPCTANIIIRGVPLRFPVTLCLRTKQTLKKVRALGKGGRTAGTGSPIGRAGFLESVAVAARGFLKSLAFLLWVGLTDRVVLQLSWPLDALDRFYKFIMCLGGKTGRGGSFRLHASRLSRNALLAPAAEQNEGFSFTVPKEKLLVNAEHSSLV